MILRSLLIGFVVAVISLPSAAYAKSARCFTTDDGYYKCKFRHTDAAGSFDISGKGKPGYSIVVDRPGFAFGYVTINGRSISISGMFVRQSDDGACWNNPETNTKVCAW
jgi:hypothetical protein